MREALREARKGLGFTSPNPAVGALLVRGNKIVARGHHRQAGAPHAEIECLQHGKVPAGATLYVTLEPCSTVGRTGACVEEIVRQGVSSVVIGTIDTNPDHRGRGITLLEKAGIKVRSGVLADECTVLNESFNKWISTGYPFVIAKCGMGLDGRLSRRHGEPRWLTDSAARRHSHGLRAVVDAILIGAETLRADDPRLTIRHGKNRHQPWRIVLTRSGKYRRSSKVFTDRSAGRTIVYKDKLLKTVLADLGKRNITSVMIEGGGNVLGQALDGGLVDKVQIYLGPILTGGPVPAFSGQGANTPQDGFHLERISYERLGQSLCVIGYPKKGAGTARII